MPKYDNGVTTYNTMGVETTIDNLSLVLTVGSSRRLIKQEKLLELAQYLYLVENLAVYQTDNWTDRLDEYTGTI